MTRPIAIVRPQPVKPDSEEKAQGRSCDWNTYFTSSASSQSRSRAMGAAGWHICFDVLEQLLAGQPIGRIVGAEAMKFGGWQRLNPEYAKQFGVPTPGWPSRPLT